MYFVDVSTVVEIPQHDIMNEPSNTDLNAGIVHQVFIHNQTTMKFLAVEWYDKPMSFLECLEWLKELKELSASTDIAIASFGVVYHINSPIDFCKWLTEVFEGNVAYGFSRRLCSDCD